MADCPTCPKERIRRPYRSGPRQTRYSTTMQPTETQLYYTAKPKRNRSPIRYSPNGCDSFYIKPEISKSYTFESIYSPLCYSPPSCPDNNCYYCPTNSEYGFLSSIRNGFQRIFYGNGSRKRNCPPQMCKDKVYRYSASQLKMMEKLLCKLEEEAFCIDESIKDALDCDYRMNCLDLKCSVNTISNQLAGLKCDLNSALDCYDPCRDKYEYDLICVLMDRANCLDSFVYDLSLQLNCLEYYPTPCVTNCRKPCCVKRPTCRPNCKKPCCYRPATCVSPPRCKPCRPSYDLNCGKPVCSKPQQYIKCQKPCCVKVAACDRPRKMYNGGAANLCRTSSVIPLGVMLVKL